MELDALLDRARAASLTLRKSPSEVRNRALLCIRAQLAAARSLVLAENQADVAEAVDLAPALRDRLTLTETRFDAMLSALDEVAALPDPLLAERPSASASQGAARSLRIMRRRIPLGVIAIVYEARPNVTVECAALTLKSGNAVVLRGGKEALRSNRALAQAVRAGLEDAGLPADAVLLIEDLRRETVAALLGATGKVDLVIPRGGKGLMNLVDTHARVPVVRHGDGICHMYLDKTVDREAAVRIVVNAKAQRPGVCNALETLLVHEAQLEFLPLLGRALLAAGVSLVADEPARAALAGGDCLSRALTPEDYATEFLAPILAIGTVPNLDAALEHIERYGTHHTAAILSEDPESAERFLREVDASCVLWNASTRFNDGGQLGLGAEMGISTSKMHVYGPMGLEGLTAEKWVVYGTGQARE